MPDFPFNLGGYVPSRGWRPLRRIYPLQRGWDVFDLQCKLAYLVYSIDTDGIFGSQTHAIVKNFQTAQGLWVDGIAGVKTQVALGAAVCAYGPLPERIHGSMEKETSLLCGIYTPLYPDGSFDRGPVQENSRYHPDHEEAFDVRLCVPVLVKRIRDNAARYKAGGTTDARAWAAAQGHWNNPTFADRYAKALSVPASFQEYIDAVTAYV